MQKNPNPACSDTESRQHVRIRIQSRPVKAGSHNFQFTDDHAPVTAKL